jgi:histidinol phosphatase-like PHP family hydrolase
MLWSSWHNHTGDGPRFSYCADLTPEAYRRALRNGPWTAFAITDHAFALALPDEEPWPFQWYFTPERLWQHSEFRDHKTEQYLERLAKICDGKRIFGGMEVEVAYDGSLSMACQLWPYLDVVVGGIHFLPGERDTWPEAHVHQLQMLLQHPIDILAHPFRELAHAGPVPGEIVDETLHLLRDNDVAVEINARVAYPGDADLLARAVRLGVRVAFGLDAHQAHELESAAYFEQVLADSGVDPNNLRLFYPMRKSAKARALPR